MQQILNLFEWHKDNTKIDCPTKGIGLDRTLSNSEGHINQRDQFQDRG